MNEKIPKIIHYIWLGKGEKNELIKKCIKSWSIFCPGFQIVEWNESKIDGIDNVFFKEALLSKNYAFASDFLRLYILYNYGGIYLDTDLELTSTIENFLSKDFFCGFENPDGFPSTALIGSIRKGKLVKLLLNYYKDKHFIQNGKRDLTPNPVIFREIIREINPQIITSKGKFFQIEDNSFIYPVGFFVKKEKNYKNFAIHHFEASWLISSKVLFELGPFQIKKLKSKYLDKPKNNEIVFFKLHYKKYRWLLFIFLR